MTGQTAHPTPDATPTQHPAQQRQQEKKDRAITALREYGTIERAAQAAGVSRSTLYRWRENDPTFETHVKQWIEQDMEDELHDTLFTIAKLGTTDAKYANAAVKAAELLIKAENREKYGDQIKTDTTLTINGQVEHIHTIRDQLRQEQQQRLDNLRTTRTLNALPTTETPGH